MAEYKLHKNLTINNIGEIYSEISKHLDKFYRLSLTITDKMEIDFSGVQLLHSLSLAAEAANKKISIKYKGKKDESNPFAICDFEDLINIKYNTHE